MCVPPAAHRDCGGTGTRCATRATHAPDSPDDNNNNNYYYYYIIIIIDSPDDARGGSAPYQRAPAVQPMCVPPSACYERSRTSTRCTVRTTLPPSAAGDGKGRARAARVCAAGCAFSLCRAAHACSITCDTPAAAHTWAARRAPSASVGLGRCRHRAGGTARSPRRGYDMRDVLEMCRPRDATALPAMAESVRHAAHMCVPPATRSRRDGHALRRPLGTTFLPIRRWQIHTSRGQRGSRPRRRHALCRPCNTTTLPSRRWRRARARRAAHVRAVGAASRMRRVGTRCPARTTRPPSPAGAG